MHSAPEKQTPNPAWAFNLDPVHSWAYWDKAFTKEECEKIIEIGNDRTIRQKPRLVVKMHRRCGSLRSHGSTLQMTWTGAIAA
jgi:predicted metal-dependent hydrolase